jgi:ABC-type multidrug transport system ATPase subunit
VLGYDPEVQTRELKDRVGVCLQSTRLQEKMKVREAIELFASFYSRTVDGLELLKRLQLWEKREALYSKLSGGQKQRLALALALLNDPQVLFLDEPSAVLDPQARREIHDLVQELRGEQRTILLTTHYSEEAEKLCDRVAIIDEGRIIAMGTPREIQERTLSTSTIEIECAQPLTPGNLPSWRDAEKMSLDDRRTRITANSARPARPSWTWSNGSTSVASNWRTSASNGPRWKSLYRVDREEPARMKPYLALFRSNMRLTLRDRSVIFFNYLFPFIFFFAFAELFHAGTGAGIAYFVGTVLTMGILGNGLWGAGMRAVQDREADILRRYKVTPIGPLPILVAAVVISPRSGRAARGGALSIRDAAAAELDLAVLDGVARRVRLRAIGLILASVTDTMQEAMIQGERVRRSNLFDQK